MGSRAHVLKILHRRIILGRFEFFSYEGTLWRGHRAVIYFILKRQIFPHLYPHGDRFYNRNINKTGKKRYLDDDDTGEKPKHLLQIGIRYTPGYDQIF